MESDSSSKRFTVTFAHFRYGRKCGHLKVYHRGQNMWEPEAKGGMTVCSIRDSETGFVYLGAAICSREDDFCYRTGREIAMGRAADQMNYDTKAAFGIPRPPPLGESGWRYIWCEEVSRIEESGSIIPPCANDDDYPAAIQSQELLGA